MRAFVFTDKALASEAGRFVWLAMDTEKPQNAALRKTLKVQALPTFFILDPADEKVALRWVGGATVPQLKRILADGTRSVARSGRGVDRRLALADSLYGEGDYAAAATAYQSTLTQAPARWPARSRAIESLLFALGQTGQNESCVQLARAELPRLRHTPSAVNVAASGLDCALSLPADHAQRKIWIAELESATREMVSDTSLAMAADDRSGAFGTLLSAREDAKDDEGKKLTAAEWAGFLEGQASRARTPDQRAVFDSHRLAAYIELGSPERAVPMLEASERDLPDDYNPPARLAAAYKAMKRWDDALKASDRALAKAYGPRKLGILQTRADIYVGRADTTAARATLEEAVQTAEALPAGQRSDASIAAIKKKLDKLR